MEISEKEVVKSLRMTFAALHYQGELISETLLVSADML